MRVQPQSVEIARLRCAECGSADVTAVAPGADDEGLGDLFLIARGTAARGWCMACCARRGWLVAA